MSNNECWEFQNHGRCQRTNCTYSHNYQSRHRHGRRGKNERRRGVLGQISRDNKVEALYEFLRSTDDPSAAAYLQMTHKDIEEQFINHMTDKTLASLWMKCASELQRSGSSLPPRQLSVDEMIDRASEVQNAPRRGQRSRGDSGSSYTGSETSGSRSKAEPGSYDHGHDEAMSRSSFEPGSHPSNVGGLLSSLGVFPLDAKTGVTLADIERSKFSEPSVDLGAVKSSSIATGLPCKTKWLGSEAYIGHFYINKVSWCVRSDTAADDPKWWEPKPSQNNQIKVMSFSDLVPLDNLRMAAVCSSEPIVTVYEEGFLSYFPPAVDLTVISASSMPKHSGNITFNFYMCTSCYDNGYGWEEGEGKCTDCRLIHHHPLPKVNANFIMLRYDDHLRFVVPSASFVRTHWEKVVHYGWYGDFPVEQTAVFSPLRSPGECPPLSTASWADVTEEEEAKANRANIFELDLREFLTDLGFPAKDYLSDIDFSRISPCVRIIHLKQGSCSEGFHRYGKYKLTDLANNIPWQSDTPIADLYITNRLGKSEPLSAILHHLFPSVRATRTTAPKLVFPSEECVAAAILHSASLTQQHFTSQVVFESFDKESNVTCYLHKTNTPVLIKANVVCRFQDETPDQPDAAPTDGALATEKAADSEGRVKRRGLLMVGSQSVGMGSWGVLQKQALTMDRVELGLGLFPFTEERNGENVVLVPDLSLVSLPIDPSDLTQYGDKDVVFSPFTPSCFEHDRRYTCLGIISRLPRDKKNFCFLDSVTLPPMSSLHARLDPFPMDPRRPQICDSFLHQDTCIRLGYHLPPLDTLVYFNGYLLKNGFRVKNILQLFRTKQEAVDFFEHGKSPSNHRAGVAERPTSPQQPAAKEARHSSESLLERRINNLGLLTEEDQERHLVESYRGQLTYMTNTFIPVSRANLEEELPMNPIQMRSNMTWLEQQVRRSCNGRMPPLTGPYSLPYLTTLMKTRLASA